MRWAPGSFTRRRRSRRVVAPLLPSSSRHAACCAWCWWQRCTGVARLLAAMSGWLEQLQRRSSAHRRWARSSMLMTSPARRGTAPPAWLHLTCSLNAPAPHQPLPTSRNHPHLSLTAPLLLLLLQCTGNHHHLGAAATCATAEAAGSARLLQSMRRQPHAWHTAYVTARECPLPVAAAGAGHHQLVALRLGAGTMRVVGGRI